MLGRHTPIGDVVVAGLQSGPSVRWFLRNQVYVEKAEVTDDVVRGHVEAGRARNAKHAVLAFVTGRLALRLDPSEVDPARTLVLWGDGERFTGEADREAWVATGARVARFVSGLPQSEEPDRVAELAGGFAGPPR